LPDEALSGKVHRILPPDSADPAIDVPWSRGQRIARFCFAVVVFICVYTVVYCLAFDGQLPGLALGWLPASGFSIFGYYHPLALLELIGECLSAF